MSKPTQAQFAQKLFANTAFTVVNGAGMLKLPNGLVVTCSIASGGEFGNYCKLYVQIANPLTNIVSRMDFLFDAYLQLKPGSRTDSHNGFCVISHTGWDWYIKQPTQESIDSMFAAIAQHVAFYA